MFRFDFAKDDEDLARPSETAASVSPQRTDDFQEIYLENLVRLKFDGSEH